MLVEIVLIISAIAVYLYFLIKQKLNLFKKLNIECDKSGFMWQLFKEVFLSKRNMFDLVESIYKSSTASIIGYYEFFTPVLIIRHPELVNQILVTDFNHFMNHWNHFSGEPKGLLSNTLFAMNDQKWKDMRATLTPAYTGSKLRATFELLRITAEDFVSNLKTEIQDGLSDVEMKDYFTRYANDIIATTAFGFQINSMKDKENQFFKMGKGVVDFGKFVMLKFVMLSHFKKLSNILKVRMISKKYSDYYMNLVTGTMNKRVEENIFRPDMINMLMEAKGISVQGSKCDLKSEAKWNDIEIVAQSLMFFFSGFETVASVLCFLTQELMENQDIQDKLKSEIQDVLAELNGEQLTYEVLNNMKYMDCVVSEGLRKWPFNAQTDRVCTKSVEIQDPETGESIQLNPGDKVMIPIVGLHRDPNYFPDPMKFDPDRFSEENKNKINPGTYIPFGAGPRMCIAHRFAFLEIKVILFYMFSDLRLDVSERSSIPLELDPTSAYPLPKNGFWVKILDDTK